MIRLLHICTVLALLAALMAEPTAAQSVNGTVNTLATILEPPVEGQSRNLAFGSVMPGTTADTGPGAESNTQTARWRFENLTKNSTYTLTVTAPTSIERTGGHTIEITWPTDYGTLCTYHATASCTSPTSFTPAAGTFQQTATTGGGQGNFNHIIEMWIGAQLPVPVNARSGFYQATMTLTITGDGF